MKQSTNATKTTPVYTFATDHLTINGLRYPVSYSVAKDGDVYAFGGLSTPEGGHIMSLRILVTKDSPLHPAIMEAVNALRAEPAKKAEAPKAQTVSETPKAAPEKAEKPATPKAKKPAAPKAKPAKKPEAPKQEAPKTEAPKQEAPKAEAPVEWRGTSLKGNGWEIRFDTAADRTRVIIPNATPAMKQAVEEAKFFWSNATQSWHKHLNDRAHKAAIALAAKLEAVTAK